MRVALVMERLEASRGGAETSTGQFIRHLLELGVTVRVVTRSPIAPESGMAVHQVAVSGATRAGRSAAFARAAERLARTLDVELVHAISPCLAADVYEPRGGTVVETIKRNLALRRPGPGRSIKRLTNRFNLRQRLMLDLERRLLMRRPPPMVVALSDYVVRQLREHYDFPASRIRRIFNGVEPDPTVDQERRADRARIRERYGIGPEELTALLVAHNFKLKGVGRWIEALAVLVERDVPVRSVVVGKGNPIRWQRRAAALGVANRVGFVGPTDNVSPFYHAADFLVHPTYYDPCSRVVLEGMAAGLPCVTTRFDGAGEVIVNGENGFVIDDPEDVAALARRAALLADPEIRTRLGTRAAATAPGFSMRLHAGRMLELYNEVAGRSRRAT